MSSSGTTYSHIEKYLNYFVDNIQCTPTSSNRFRKTSSPAGTIANPLLISSTKSTSSSPKAHSSEKQRCFSDNGMMIAKEHTNNPFGVKAVGNIIAIIPCTTMVKAKTISSSSRHPKSSQGHLYITTKAICYRRIGIFGFEMENVIIPFHIISTIEKSQDYKHEINKNGIRIQTNTGKHQSTDSKTYFFECTVQEVDDAFMELLHKTWKEAPKTIHKSAVNEMFQCIATLSFDNQQQHCQEEEKDGCHSPCQYDNNIVDDEQEQSNIEVILNISSVESDHDHYKDDDRLKSQWDEYHHSIVEKSYEHKVATKIHLNCTVKEFFTTFIADTSKISLPSIHQKTGSFDVNNTKWSIIEGSSKSSDGEGNTKMQRKIRYKNPVHVPMGPSYGQAEKTQILTQFGTHGFGIITKTWIHGVPLADCFFVEDCLLVEKADATCDDNTGNTGNTGENGIYISIMFDVTFVQRTMLKNIISRTAINDVTKFFIEYAQIVQSTVKNQADATKNDLNDSRTSTSATDLVIDEDDSHDDYDETLPNEFEQVPTNTTNANTTPSTTITVATEKKKLGVFQTIMKVLSQLLKAMSLTMFSDVKPIVWLLLLGLLLNQWYLQGRIAMLEATITNTAY